MNYVELRGHSQYSVGFATGKLEEYLARSKDLGMESACLVERDSLRGIYDFHKAAKKAGIRPIFGVELAVVDDMGRHGLSEAEMAAIEEKVPKKREQKRAISRELRRLGIDRAPTVCLRAATDEGITNLYRLVSIGWERGWPRIPHTRPRVDRATLASLSTGVSVSVGGADAFALEALLRGDVKAALADLEWLRDTFEGRAFLEIQPHAGLNVQTNLAVARLSEVLEIPAIAVNDTRYVYPSEVDVHTIVLCLNRRNMTLSTPEHPVSQPGYHLRGADDMMSAFTANHPDLVLGFVADAINRTVEVAATLHGAPVIDPLRGLIPQIAEVEDPAAEVRKLCEEGWVWRDIEGRSTRTGVTLERYRSQLEHELQVFASRKLDPYFLIVKDVIGWCRKNGVFVGPGRGSSAGSLACYLLGITAIDPLEHGLMFERFLAPGRNDMPDIDTDFAKSQRERAIDYVREKYGAEHVAHIGTHGVMHGKSALKDVCRIMDVPFGVINAITASFSQKQGDEELPVREVLESSEAGAEFIEHYPSVMEVVERLEGSVRQVGVHASGILVTPVGLPEVCPVELHERKGEVTTISSINMKGVSDYGLLKLDMLGLGNLDVLADVQTAVWERHGIILDFEALTFDDPKVIDAFTRQEFTGVFQYDAASARSVCADLTFKGFHDVVALTALNRPGCTRSGLTEKFRLRRMDPSRYEPLHPIYDAITGSTEGVLVYQEQLIRICREMGGFSAERADAVRKIIGKKLGVAAMEEHRVDFVKGGVERGVPLDDVELIYDTMVKAGEYSFNASHATAYAAIGYWEMWAKVYYPAEFIWALMNRAESQDEASGYVNEARRLGVEILGPDVNESGDGWTLVDGNRIRAGLRGITSVGSNSTGAIMDGRPFKTMSEFFERVSGRQANARVVENLIRAGAMRDLIPCTRWALENRETWLKLRAKPGPELDEMIESSRDAEEYTAADLRALAYNVCPQGIAQHPVTLYDDLFAKGAILGDVEWLDIDDPDIWKSGGGFIRGLITDVRFKTVGDFGGGSDLTEEQKELKGWGRRFAVITLEAESGSQVRVKLEPDVFDKFGDIVGRPKDRVCVVVHVDILPPPHRSVRAHYVADLEAIRQKTRLSIPLSQWERCFTLRHPVSKFSRKRLSDRKSPFEAPVLITHVREVVDKNGNRMAFFGLQDGRGGFCEAVAFHEAWGAHGAVMEPGCVVEGVFKREKNRGRDSIILGDRGIIQTFGRVEELDNVPVD